eukprot:Phypoly_transcript_16746.p1 GENE.Phypoly_transcript_16746~~Phypoly_transcript_16746.p1  ORF type:complete len:229 (+),score=33.05 Phypoly_transcript_16746:161-847(+)
MRLPKNYWQNKSNVRNLLVEFADKNQFDPLSAENWYSVQPDLIQGIAGVLNQYNGSFTKALVELFPEVNFVVSKFGALPRNFWQDPQNKRKVFEEYASKNGFGPLIPSNWYPIHTDQFLASGIKGAWSVMAQYNNSMSRALTDLFPQIGLEISKFSIVPKNFWQSKENRKQFLESVAKEHCVDPLVLKNWSSVDVSYLKKVLKFYNGNLAISLKDLFPEMKYATIKLS